MKAPGRLRSLAIAVFLQLLFLTFGCGPETSREQFDSIVVPILERRCLTAACHGVALDAEARGEVIDWTQLHIRITDAGLVADLDQAYDIVKSRIDTAGRPEFSSLLRTPLAPEFGGQAHLGGTIFESRSVPDYIALRDWVAAEEGGGEGGLIEDLPPNSRQFASEVLPHLATRQCMNGSCHGPFAPFTAFRPPIAIDGDYEFSYDDIEANYRTAKMHLFLGGDPALSRLVRKGLPLDRGGIAHRGGNDIFFVESAVGDPGADPAVAAITAWAEKERADALGGAPAMLGFVFVRGPVAPNLPFSHDAFAPGSDLFVLDAGASTPRNLTAAAHPDGPADIRDPAVDHGATRIAFAMRKSDEDAHNLYEIGADGSGLRQLTHDSAALPGGGRVANVQPAYGPDGRIYFASTRSGHLADRGEHLDTEIWAVDPNTGALERLTHDPAPEATPHFIGVGKSYGTLAFTVLRTIGARYESAVFRMPLDHNKKYHGDPELHVHHGITSGADAVYDMRTMPDGRFVASLLGGDSVWRGGYIAIFDRQFGPDLPQFPTIPPASGGFRHAFTFLNIPPGPGDKPVAIARRPVPLPDGRLLVTLAHGEIKPSDPSKMPDFGAHILTLEEDRQTGGPRVAGREVLIDEPGIAEYDAVPIVARPLEDDPSHELAWDPQADTGRLAYRHVETLEAIMSNLLPMGPKPLRDDLVYARIIESLPLTPADVAKAPISIGVHGRTRILGEVPLAGGSLYLEVPAGRPFRIQTLDADRMATGAQHNRWIDVAPGQTFPGGVAPALYPALCASCHGSLSGDPGNALGPVPDIVTAASITLATHENLDPRRPKPPVPVGAEPVEIDFRTDVLPILTASCVKNGCHSATTAAGGLALEATPTAHFDTAYESLLAAGSGSGNGRKYVDEAGSSARRSYLVELIYGRELDAPRALAGSCLGDPPLTEAQRLTIVRWIDLGAVYRGGNP